MFNTQSEFFYKAILSISEAKACILLNTCRTIALMYPFFKHSV